MMTPIILQGINRHMQVSCPVLMGDLNFPDVNWEHHVVDTNRSEKCMQYAEVHFGVGTKGAD